MGRTIGNNQVGDLSPAIHLGSHCRWKMRRRNKGFHCAYTSNFSSSFKVGKGKKKAASEGMENEREHELVEAELLRMVN